MFDNPDISFMEARSSFRPIFIDFRHKDTLLLVKHTSVAFGIKNQKLSPKFKEKCTHVVGIFGNRKDEHMFE